MSVSRLSAQNDDHHDGPELEVAPQTFVRVVTARPGAPWDQWRQVKLDARMSAPSRVADLIYRIRRLGPWRLREEARFAVIYARADDAREGLVARPTIDGRPVTVHFLPAAEQRRRIKRGMIVAWIVAISIAGAITSGVTVLSRRAATADQLSSVERLAQVRAKQLGQLAAEERDARALDDQNLRGQRIANLLSDLAWASRSKAPEAHILALHWDHGFMGVEVEGGAAPFDATDRQVQRSRTQLRPGVWLWGEPSTDPWGQGPAAISSAGP